MSAHPVSDIAFTPAVKAIQSSKGSREAYARMESGVGWQARVTPDLADFIGGQTSIFFGTATAAGQPYIQHRGGPAGFLRVLDDQTIAFADFTGNKQFISVGNLAENPKAYLFLIDYAARRRIKIWGTARVVTDNPKLLSDLMLAGYPARPDQAIVFTIEAWDANCPQHIPVRFEAADVQRALDAKDRRIAGLEARLARLEKPGC